MGEIKGKTAFNSSEIIKGKAKIVSDKEDIEKVHEGDIVITSNIGAEFIGYLKNSGALKKASALITDEGGITCHAAIISREMKKPCIVGAKNVLKMIKDGDDVEVDANHGQRLRPG